MKVETQVVEIHGIQIAIPVGPIHEPTEESKRIMGERQDLRNWKLPVKPYYTFDKKLADDVAACLDFYCGGHEMDIVEYNRYGTVYRVQSRGYYHYVGA